MSSSDSTSKQQEDFESFAFAEWKRRRSERALAAASKKRLTRFESTTLNLTNKRHFDCKNTENDDNFSLCSVSTTSLNNEELRPGTADSTNTIASSSTSSTGPNPLPVQSLKSLLWERDNCNNNNNFPCREAIFNLNQQCNDSTIVSSPSAWINPNFRMKNSSKMNRRTNLIQNGEGEKQQKFKSEQVPVKKKRVTVGNASTIEENHAEEEKYDKIEEKPNADLPKKKQALKLISANKTPTSCQKVETNTEDSLAKPKPADASVNDSRTVSSFPLPSSSFEFEYGIDRPPTPHPKGSHNKPLKIPTVQVFL